MDFWFYNYDNDGNIVESLESFFEDAGAKNPDEAPNYATMPDKPQKKRWFEQNKSMEPMKNPKPSVDNKKAFPDSKNSKQKSNTKKVKDGKS